MILPWQNEQWQQLWQRNITNRLPHALLFTGIAGIGKSQFANDFIQALLCESPLTNMPIFCDRCHACRLSKNKTHPNIYYVEPEKLGAAIKVDQIRLMNDFAQQTSLQGHYRIMLINPADDMNINAANALLKTLEEPPAGALIILVSHQHKRLPATIISRCQQIVFPLPPFNEASEWLQQQVTTKTPEILLRLAHGAPLAAVAFAGTEKLLLRETLLEGLYLLAQQKVSPLKVAEKMANNDTLLVIDFMLSWVIDLLRLQVGVVDVINHDYQHKLIEAAKATSTQNNLRWLSHLHEARKKLCEGINLNKQLLIESLLIQ